MRKTIILGALALTAIPSTASAMPHPASAAAPTLTWCGQSWRLMHGTGRLGQRWDPSHVSVQNGVLQVRVTQGVGGGATMLLNRTYGSYAARFRMTRGTGKPVFLLWPQNGSRPEIDFAEGKKDDANRTVMTANWHPSLSSTVHVARLGIDYTRWHTFAVTWSRSGLVFSVDGRIWGRSSATSHVPMHLTIQANYKGGSAPASTLQVASVGMK